MVVVEVVEAASGVTVGSELGHRDHVVREADLRPRVACLDRLERPDMGPKQVEVDALAQAEVGQESRGPDTGEEAGAQHGADRFIQGEPVAHALRGQARYRRYRRT